MLRRVVAPAAFDPSMTRYVEAPARERTREFGCAGMWRTQAALYEEARLEKAVGDSWRLVSIHHERNNVVTKAGRGPGIIFTGRARLL